MANHFFHLQIEGNSKRSSAQLNEQGDGPSLSSRRPAVEVSGIFPSFTRRFFYRALKTTKRIRTAVTKPKIEGYSRRRARQRGLVPRDSA